MAWRFYTSGGVIVTADTTDHGALTGLGDDDHTQYLLVDGTRALTGELQTGDNAIVATELSTDPTTPTTSNWKLYFKAGGLYHVDDAGTVTGPLGTGGGSTWTSLTDTPSSITPNYYVRGNSGGTALEMVQDKKNVILKVIADDSDLSTGDGKMYFTIPSELNGLNLIDADAAVYTASTSGTPTIQIHNVTDAVDMLSTRITIDANEYSSYTAATPPVIDTDYDDVATGDRLRIDVDVAGTGTKGLDVILVFG